jgi:predicted HTH transcriptional regulator
MQTRADEILAGMPPGIHTTRQLRIKFGTAECTIRRIMSRLVAEGKVAKEEIDRPGRKNNHETVGWRKL